MSNIEDDWDYGGNDTHPPIIRKNSREHADKRAIVN